MFDKNIIYAVDLGSTHITLMAAEVDDDYVRVLAVEQSTVKKDCVHNGIVVNASDVAFQIGELTKKMNNSLRLKKGKEISSMYVSVNAKTMKCIKHTVVRSFLNFTEITDQLISDIEKECRQTLTQDQIEVYDIIPIDYQLDNTHSKTPPKRKGYNLQVTYNVVIGNHNIGKNILGIFERTPEITFKQYKPLSMETIAEAVLSPEDCNDGVALINFGATTTTLALYIDGILETLMVVPLGSNNITKDMQSLGISESYAEKLKLRYGVAMETMVERIQKIAIPPAQPNSPDVLVLTSFLAEIVEARLNEIFAPIFEILKINKNKIGAGIVLTGGGSNLKGIVDYIQKKTDMYTVFGTHADKLAKHTDKKFENPFYTQLIGMCLLIDSYRRKYPDNDIDVIINWKEKLKQWRKKVEGKIIDFIPPLTETNNPL